MTLSTDTSTKTLEVGTILKKSWGYSMTLVDWYVVVRRTAKTAWIQEIQNGGTEDHGPEGGYCVPDFERKAALVPTDEIDERGHQVYGPAPVTRHKIHTYGDEEILRDRNGSSIRVWDQRRAYINTWD